MKNSNQNQAAAAPLRGFTLIELIVVIAIIAILAALMLQTAGFVQNKGARSRAEAEIAALSAALESYKVEFGEYPRGTNTSKNGNNAFLYTALTPTNRRPFFEFPKNMTNATGNIVDPFGQTYAYQFPGNTNRSGAQFFDLWSYGNAATNAVDVEKWIKNW